MRTLVHCSKKAGKSLDEVKHDLESEAAASSKKEMKVASDEAKNKSSASTSMAPTSDSGSAGGMSAPAPAPFSRFCGGSGGGQLGGDGVGGRSYHGIEPDTYEGSADMAVLGDLIGDDKKFSNFSWSSPLFEGDQQFGVCLGERTGREDSRDERSERHDDAAGLQSTAHSSTIGN